MRDWNTEETPGTQAPAVQPTREVAARGIVPRGQKHGVNASDSRLGLRIPMLRPLSKIKRAEQDQGFRLGQLRYGERSFDSLEVILLKVDDVRQLDEKTPGVDEQPRTTCASSNGRTPCPEVETPKAAACASCELGQWKDGVKAGKPARIPPPCENGFAVFGVIPSLGNAPFWLLARNTAEPNCRAFQRAFLDPTCPAVYLHELRVTIGTEAQTSGGLEWFVPTFRIDGIRTEAEAAKLMPLYEQASGVAFVPYLHRGAAGGASPSGGDAPQQDWPSDDDEIPF